MALIFITGVAGSGKSAVSKELVARGFEAYDTYNDGITAWVIKETDEEVNLAKPAARHFSVTVLLSTSDEMTSTPASWAMKTVT